MCQATGREFLPWTAKETRTFQIDLDKPGAAPRPYYVRWDNGIENSYRVEDLERATEPSTEPDSEPDTKIIPFARVSARS